MAYRVAKITARWTSLGDAVLEADLPPHCHVAFEAFEKLLEHRGVMGLPEGQRSTVLELPAPGTPELYLPDYSKVRPSTAISVAGAGCMTVAIVAVFGGLIGLAEAIPGAEWLRWGLLVVGGGVVVLAHGWWWWTEWRDFRRIRNHPRTLALGTFLLGDEIVERNVNCCRHFARSRIDHLVVKRASSNSTSHSLRFTLEGSHGRPLERWIALEGFGHPEERREERIERWYRETAPERDGGDHQAPEG